MSTSVENTAPENPRCACGSERFRYDLETGGVAFVDDAVCVHDGARHWAGNAVRCGLCGVVYGVGTVQFEAVRRIVERNL